MATEKLLMRSLPNLATKINLSYPARASNFSRPSGGSNRSGAAGLSAVRETEKPEIFSRFLLRCGIMKTGYL